jgi:hypothetical protein
MTHQHNHNSKNSTFVKQTRNLALVLCMGTLAGVLIWAKLRLVTDIPRSAYADPREVEIPEDHAQDSDLDQSSDTESEAKEVNEIDHESMDSQLHRPEAKSPDQP